MKAEMISKTSVSINTRWQQCHFIVFGVTKKYEKVQYYTYRVSDPPRTLANISGTAKLAFPTEKNTPSHTEKAI